MQNAVTALGAVVVYQVAEAGISNILALNSYELATDLFCNIMLRLYGGEKGRVNINENHSILRSNQVHFFFHKKQTVFHIYFIRALSYRSLATKSELNGGDLIPRIVFPLAKRVFVRGYAILSTYEFLTFANQSTIQKRFNLIASLFFYLLPPMRVKFTAKVMESCPSDPQVWLNKFEANQIGLRGLVMIGINKETPRRMINNPKQVMVGIIQLGLSFLLVHLLFERFKSSPYLTATAMMLA
jgi:hypothetical protein